MMRNIIFVCSAFIFSSSLLAQNSNEILVGSTIDFVNVYFKGAEITRKFNFPVKMGRSTIILSGISSKVESQSVQVKLPQGLRLISLFIETNPEHTLNKNARYILLQDSIRHLENMNHQIEMQIRGLQEEQKTLIGNSTRIGQNQGISLAELDQTLTYFRKKTEEINGLIFRRENEHKKNKASVSLYENEVTNIETEHSLKAAIIKLVVENDAPLGQSESQISYFTPECGWSPSYNIYNNGIGQSIRLDYKARVLNLSGEYWQHVKLQLVTGYPIRSLTAPELETWSLSYRQQKRSGKVYGEVSNGTEGTLSKSQIKNGAPISGSYKGDREIELEEGQLTFPITGIWDVPSSLMPFSVEVAQHDLNARFSYRVVPKIDASAYLIAQIGDWEELKLIEGETNVFYNQQFMGKGYLNPFAAGDTLELSLGSDPNLQVTRVKKKDFSDRKIIGLQLVEKMAYEIDIRNLYKKEIDIEVIDQVPISAQEEITIKTDELDGASQDEVNGKLVWNLKIPAQQTVKIKMGFTVRYPKDKVVIVKRTGRILCPSDFY
jgi:uncharacterized protein (TIGR02231 family)